ncbi:MAG: hypothetical protein IJI34_07310 [Clostridia bacterium]|nr:hypothetical protein [Clostridia bacterium]
MTVKDFIVSRIRLFFFLTVMILLAQSIVGTVAEPGVSLHIRYIDLLSPLYMAGLCTLPTVVTYSKKKLSIKQVLIRHAIQLVLIEGVIMLISFTSPSIDTKRPEVIFLIGGIVLVIYVLAVLMMWLGQVSESKKMTAQLHVLQQSADSDSQM